MSNTKTMTQKSFQLALLAAAMPLVLMSGLAQAQNTTPCNIKVQDAWVRTTVPGQKGTGAFMRLTADHACQLVAVQSPIASVAQVHRMEMQNDVMHMRPIQGGLPLPAGQTVALTPGGLHVMLMDLKQPVTAGTSVPITLTLQDQKRGAQGQITVEAAVRPLGSGDNDAAQGGMAHNPTDHMQQ